MLATNEKRCILGRESDYINANMPRIGNTAFGEREDLAIPYRDIKIKVETEAEGVLVYSVDAKLATGQNPVIVYPMESIGQAPFHPGDTFRHDDAPFEIEVIERDPVGAYLIEIRIGSE